MKLRSLSFAKIFAVLIFAIILSAATVFNICSASEVIKAPGGEVTNYDELVVALGGEDAVQLKDGYVLLYNDIELQSPLVLTESNYIIIGAGCVITGSFSDSSYLIVGDGEKKASLVLGSANTATENENIIFDGGGKTIEGSLIAVNYEATLETYVGTVFRSVISDVIGGAIYSEGAVCFYNGIIENCRSTGSGGAIFSKGTLYLASGIIQNCSAEYGGAVYSEGTSEFIGTEIKDCTANRGGAVFSTGTLNFRSSSVSECTAASGGAVYTTGVASFIGGQIVSCSADSSGGAVYNCGSADFSGTYINENNAINGGNIYNTGKITQSEGSVYAGKATGNGGNIYNDTLAELTVSGGSVGRGEAIYGGGIYNLGTLNISGGTFNLNKAECGQAILNSGTLIFSKSPYIDKKNDVFIVTDKDGTHAVNILTELTAEQTAVLTPGVTADNGYAVSYTENSIMLTGEFCESNSHRFNVTADNKTKWVVGSDGRLEKILPVYEKWWFYLVLSAAFAATVVLLVVVIKAFNKYLKK